MKRFSTSLRHALRGIGCACMRERNLRIQVGIALIVIIAGLLIRLSSVEWALAVIAITLVLGAELINTALEHILDFLSPGHSEEVRFAKDVMAGVALVQTIGSIIVGLSILAHHFGMMS